MMLFPCMFGFVACKDKPSDPPSNEGLTAEQKQQAYTTFRTVATTILNNNGAKDQSYTLQYSNETTDTMNFVNSGLTTQQQASLDSSFVEPVFSKRVKTVYGGYKTNNTGYRNEISKFEDSSGAANLNQTNSEIVKQNGQKFELYKKEDNTKTLSYVNDLYAKNEFVVDEKMLFEDGDYQKLSDILEQTETNTNFDNFKNYLVNWSAETIAEGKIVDSSEQDLSQYVIADYDFSLDNGVYELKITVELDIDKEDDVLEDDSELDGVGAINVVFDSTSIKKVDFSYESNLEVEEPSSSVLQGYFNQNFGTDDYVIKNKNNKINIKLDLTTAFDNEYFNQNLTGYTGTGANGEVGNVKVTGTIALANANLDDSSITVEFEYGDNLKDCVDDAIADILSDNDLYVASYSLIYNGQTSDITDQTKVPASEFIVYVQLTTENEDYEVTIVDVYQVNDNSKSTCSLYVGKKLYAEIKLVFGLTDADIEGIYSDSELTNRLSTDTLVEEDMVIYLVLADNTNNESN